MYSVKHSVKRLLSPFLPKPKPIFRTIELDANNSFVDSTGHRIDFVQGWYERKILPPAYASYQTYVERLVRRQSGHDDQVAYPVDMGMFIDKINEAETVVQVLKENFIDLEKIQTVLDIGTGPAIIPRVFKMSGFGRERAVGIDILNRSTDFPDDKIRQNLQQLRAQLLDGTLPAPLLTNLMRSHSFIPDNHPNVLAFQTDLVDDFSLDRYCIGDFLTFDFGEERFDLVVTHTGLIYFDMETYFDRISSLLQPGGVHFLMDINWYHIHGTVMYLPLDAPWLHTRVSKPDLIRYYQEKHPDVAAYIEQGLYWKNSHYTPQDVKQCAARHGLRAVSLRRFFDSNSRRDFSYKYPANLRYVTEFVLPEARALNPYVDVADLYTFTFLIVFVKE